MENVLISNNQVDYFLYDLEKKLSEHYHAGVICDKDGFIISARIPKKYRHDLHAHKIALSAIASKKRKKKNSEYIEVIRDLDDRKNIILILLLKKDKYSKIRSQYKQLNQILSFQDIF